MDPFVYRGERTREISFPLGGIGTGCIGLSGNGRLIDWEIFNRPNKGSINGFTHFAIKAEAGGRVLDARVLQGDLLPPYSGDLNRGNFQSFGFGPHRATLAGAPHFRDVTFEAAYPLARLSFAEEAFPGTVALTAFNPFIPLNDGDSSIPGAFFEWEIVNTTAQTIQYTLALSLNNPFEPGASVNRYQRRDSVHAMRFLSTRWEPQDLDYGDMTIATDADDVSWQEYWFRGSWFDNLGVYWQDFTAPGRLGNRSYQVRDKGDRHPAGRITDTGTLAAHVSVGPGETKKVRYIISWNYPNCNNYWNPEKCDCQSCECDTSKPKGWKNYYATVFSDSLDSAVYGLADWDRLYGETRLFHDALLSSTLPAEALDAVTANLSILKSPTCLRLTDGSFYGFEGCHCTGGCCEGSCTHVWNYAYALPFLFPRLERSMRDLDFAYNQRDDGGMSFRLQLPLGRERSAFRPCADGQFGGVIKAYRDWKISGDSEWLKKNWHAIRKSIEYAWAPTNEDRWDADRDGVLEGRQHHTLDMELFGPNSWLTGFYLAALKAGAEMAAFLGDAQRAAQYGELFGKGKKWVDENLFNGEYYCQRIDLTDRSLLERYDGGQSLTGGNALDTYWNEEAGEIKYQVGEGSLIDQVLAQWHANLCGLGEIFDRDHVKKALLSIHRYNYKKSMRDFFNPCRLYTLNDEGGAVICEWPEGAKKPVIPVPYSQETMYGFEYQAAIHMIQEGFTDQGMEIVRTIRARFDGAKRNPWNEFECGSNYARSMASYALLNAFSGFEFDRVRDMMGFDPVTEGSGEFRTFWSLDGAWGLFSLDGEKARIEVLGGEMRLRELRLPAGFAAGVGAVTAGGGGIAFRAEGRSLFMDAVTIAEGGALEVRRIQQ